ncbi:uncharacterized protein ColSpa_05036 [Colletotrichum spaethianum]|uniref:Uncharacterized protein n=1 Tax=Colletotrichum spaethianum TaxID=700344 RepID=A0AA37NZU7_9PEZI|nr:uncharacterized protein ColSpa_05036 [Colletotrichum spaethianum]GKT44855.1 hypothetical protein ColSpa_05036 [Colletotrichum spaethianum]
MALYNLAQNDFNAQNLKNIENAFNRFESAIYPVDAKLFRSLSLDDVWNAAKVVEQLYVTAAG